MPLIRIMSILFCLAAVHGYGQRFTADFSPDGIWDIDSTQVHCAEEKEGDDWYGGNVTDWYGTSLEEWLGETRGELEFSDFDSTVGIWLDLPELTSPDDQDLPPFDFENYFGEWQVKEFGKDSLYLFIKYGDGPIDFETPEDKPHYYQYAYIYPTSPDEAVIELVDWGCPVSYYVHRRE